MESDSKQPNNVNGNTAICCLQQHIQFLPDILTHYFNHINYTLFNPYRDTNLGSCDSSHIMFKSIYRILICRSDYKARKEMCFLWTVSHLPLCLLADGALDQQFINSSANMPRYKSIMNCYVHRDSQLFICKQ